MQLLNLLYRHLPLSLSSLSSLFLPPLLFLSFLFLSLSLLFFS